MYVSENKDLFSKISQKFHRETTLLQWETFDVTYNVHKCLVKIASID